MAGIGDFFFGGTLRLIATGIGTSLALKGNILYDFISAGV
ncbi:PTS system mannose/fructose/sorbose family transporter subunit IID [Salmonella enterica subsp. enterica]|nr:PTS system mannose/fructose/sorbose family transporter subunit IID [Salmonella enterica subsp. enterica]